uniref:ABC transporter domain-containing protein n=1 Tax=Timema shepardi TaxID=629360 RepID=A0A7R9B049_TIMSH|nr:unnamed protein product [Timema shepardi]
MLFIVLERSNQRCGGRHISGHISASLSADGAAPSNLQGSTTGTSSQRKGCREEEEVRWRQGIHLQLADTLGVRKEAIHSSGMGGWILSNGEVRKKQRPSSSTCPFRKESAYIMQDDQLWPLFTVLEVMNMSANLKLGFSLSTKAKHLVVSRPDSGNTQDRTGRIRTKKWWTQGYFAKKEEGGSEIDDILDTLGLNETRMVSCKDLSGGQKKRLSIALEMVDNPPVMFLDEPTTLNDSVPTLTYDAMVLSYKLSHSGTIKGISENSGIKHLRETGFEPEVGSRLCNTYVDSGERQGQTVELNTTSALANYATEAGPGQSLLPALHHNAQGERRIDHITSVVCSSGAWTGPGQSLLPALHHDAQGERRIDHITFVVCSSGAWTVSPPCTASRCSRRKENRSSNVCCLFLRGLDSLSSLHCITMLKALARGGRTIVCTIHQPSATMLEMFDHVYVLAEGMCAYQGSSDNIVPFLSSVGLNCPQYHNPADYSQSSLVIL